MGLRGLEPPTSPLSGVRSNQLSYSPILQKRTTGIEPAFPAWKAGALAIVLHPHNIITMLWRGAESNRRHYELQSYALPTELPRQYKTVTTGFEPVIFRVTGERHNQLDHATNR